MPFIAQCPFCGHHAQCPDHAAGASGRCPRCRDHYTLAPRDAETRSALAKQRAFPLLSPDGRSEPVPVAPPSAAAQQVTALPPRALAEAPVEMPASHDEAPASDLNPPPSRWLDPLAAAALLPLGAAVACAYVPGLCIAVIPLAVLALLVALASIARAIVVGQARVALSITTSLLGLVVFVVAVFYPSLLGNTYLASRLHDPGDPKVIRAIPFQAGVSPDETEWVDASRAGLQQGNLRLRIIKAWIGPAESRDAKKKSAQEDRLFVLLRAYHVDDPGVSIDHPPPYRDEEQHPRLTDNAGKSYAERPERDRKDAVGASKFPVKAVDEVLVFEPPPASADYLHLELPAAGWGHSGNFRFTIPRSMIERKPSTSPPGTGRRSGS